MAYVLGATQSVHPRMYGLPWCARYRHYVAEIRDQAVRVTLGIPLHVVAAMAGVSRFTLIRYELAPSAVRDGTRRARIGAVYDDLRALLARYPVLHGAPA